LNTKLTPVEQINIGMDSILCLDTSGSMSGNSLKELQAAVLAFIEYTQKIEGGRIAIVEFGKHTGIRISLTDKMREVIRVVTNLEAGGGTPMAEGLLFALKELAKNGKLLAIGPVKLMPRLILMTDGNPDKSTEVLQVAAAIGEAGFPVACVGVSGCDVSLMQQIATLTGGMFTFASKIEELQLFFVKQIILTLYIVQFANSLEELYSREALREYMYQKTGTHLSEEELDAFVIYLNSLAKHDQPAPPKVEQKSKSSCLII